MSHFTVLVIGANPEAQLEPFNEEKFYEIENPEVTSTCSPKWDWYSLGGRWAGFFKLKDGAHGMIGISGIFTAYAQAGYADHCLKGDVDIDGMRDEAAKTAKERWEAFRKIVTQEQIDSFVPWKVILERHGKEGIDAARAEYHDQPLCKAVKAADDNQFAWEFDDVLCSLEEKVERARNTALSTFAVLKDGEWYERGEMGWWGMVADEKDADVWAEEFNKLFDSLPDDTPLWLYDCHI